MLFRHCVVLGLLLAAGSLSSSCASVKRGPVGFWSRNRYDRSGDQRHGPWREYFDMEEKRLANQGRYRHGRAVGRWRYYSPTGELERTEQYHRRPYGQVTLAYYYANGQLSKRGQALYRSEPTVMRFFWFGEWQCFAPDGRSLPSEYYQNGHQVPTPATTTE